MVVDNGFHKCAPVPLFLLKNTFTCCLNNLDTAKKNLRMIQGYKPVRLFSISVCSTCTQHTTWENNHLLFHIKAWVTKSMNGEERGFSLLCLSHSRSPRSERKQNKVKVSYQLHNLLWKMKSTKWDEREINVLTEDTNTLTVVGIVTVSSVNLYVSFTIVAGKYPMMPIWSTYRSL